MKPYKRRTIVFTPLHPDVIMGILIRDREISRLEEYLADASNFVLPGWSSYLIKCGEVYAESLNSVRK